MCEFIVSGTKPLLEEAILRTRIKLHISFMQSTTYSEPLLSGNTWYEAATLCPLWENEVSFRFVGQVFEIMNTAIDTIPDYELFVCGKCEEGIKEPKGSWWN